MKHWLMAAPSVVARWKIKKTDTGCIAGTIPIPVKQIYKHAAQYIVKH